jgi:hypothetical protein
MSLPFSSPGACRRVALPDAGTIANIATAAAVLTGLSFGIIQIRQQDRKRQDSAAIAAIQSLQTEAAFESTRLVLELPEGLAAEELRARPEVVRAANQLHMAFEPLGYMVFRRLVPLRMVDELAGGAVRATWPRLKPLAEWERRASGNPNRYEWYQWLAERLDERAAPGKLQGAHLAHRGWRP